MAAAYPMMHETVWFDQSKYEKAEAHYQEQLAQAKYGVTNSPAAAAAPAASQEASSDLVNEIARARQHIQSSLNTSSGASGVDHSKRIEKLEKENDELRKMLNGLCERIKKLELQVGTTQPMEQAKAEPAKKEEESDDNDDLFGSDSEEDEEMARLLEEKKEAELAAKAKKKPPPVGKSSILMSIKGWDDETDFKTLEANIRNIEKEGLRWGMESKLIPVAYGIKKLQMNAIVVDDLVGVDFLEDSILAFEDYVQSVDIDAFNKI